MIGGGLTAIDAATELMAYYPRQVEKTLERYETLATASGEAAVRRGYDSEELELLDEYLGHGRAVRAERTRAAAAGEAPDFVPLVRAWGGVAVVYRKRLIDAPAYRLNHEEVIKALEEGIAFVENLTPIAALPDEHGAVKAMLFTREVQDASASGDATATLPARTVLVAAGTTPNTTYEKERAGSFQLDEKRKFFQPHEVVPRCHRPSSSDPELEWLLHLVPRRRPVCELFRRQPPAVCRQRREGHGIGERRLSAPCPAVRGGGVCLAGVRRRTRGTRRGRRWCAGSMAISTPGSKTWSGSRRPSSK